MTCLDRVTNHEVIITLIIKTHIPKDITYRNDHFISPVMISHETNHVIMMLQKRKMLPILHISKLSIMYINYLCLAMKLRCISLFNSKLKANMTGYAF